jgi:hypothetical protein
MLAHGTSRTVAPLLQLPRRIDRDQAGAISRCDQPFEIGDRAARGFAVRLLAVRFGTPASLAGRFLAAFASVALPV